MDNLFRESLKQTINLDLTDAAWLQATLPVRNGGLGIRRVSSLALPAFLAFAAGTLPVQASILSGTSIHPDIAFEPAAVRWFAESGIPRPPNEVAHRQSLWDRPLLKKDLDSIRKAITGQDKTRLEAMTAKRASEWLLAPPISACG